MAEGELRLCIFARAPVRGRVKQRLAAELGDERALAVHIELVEGTLMRCTGRAAWRTDLWIADGDAGDPLISDWCDRFNVTFKSQQGDDLGARMNHALTACVMEGAVPVLIGCDCPDIDALYVERAFSALDEADVVLGPAEDGGYGLMGIRRPAPSLFDEIPWGTDRVLERTLQRAAESGLVVELLAPIRDVDTVADWRRYSAAIE
jgi:rSAM/selenodomain-associated transferase 1